MSATTSIEQQQQQQRQQPQQPQPAVVMMVPVPPLAPLPLSMDSLPTDTLKRRKTLVQQTWRSVEFGLGEQAIKVMYEHLFQDCPEVKSLFEGVTMSTLYTKFFAMLRLAVRSLDDFDVVVPTLVALGRRHAKSYGVQRKHYRAMTHAFQRVLQDYIFAHWANMVCTQYIFDVTDAWGWCLNGMGDIMADGADLDEEDL
jgi:hemoglobin-like flavoprotein